MTPQQILMLELNEVNFHFIEGYIARGRLPAFRDFFNRHGFRETSSEARYEELEPWIQWVTAHTGLPLASHGVFRLGDIVKQDIPQIWERLEELGLKVGAISPMNAKCRVKNPAFFLPDPWTETGIVAPPHQRRMYKAIAQAVSDNASSKITLKSALDLALGWLRTARPGNYLRYLSYLKDAKKRPWRRAMFLDLLLSELFIQETAAQTPNFATLFLNAAAHIQHHYIFSSVIYDGELRNPSWYLKEGEDPVLDVYELYDQILGHVLHHFPNARVIVATGLHQDPHSDLTYYWRLCEHTRFLGRIGVEFASVQPLMSRDFLLRAADAAQAEAGAQRLAAARAPNGEPLFEVYNRGTDLFVMLTYPHDVPTDMSFTIGKEIFHGLRDDVAFVAIKNGRHNGIGYISDSSVARASCGGSRMPLAGTPRLYHFGIHLLRPPASVRGRPLVREPTTLPGFP